MHEWPQCESCTAALYGAAKVRLGPVVSVKGPDNLVPVLDHEKSVVCPTKTYFLIWLNLPEYVLN
jgi:hypothetical protein